MDTPTRDDVLEEIASFIGGFDVREVAGIGAKRKRAREDAQLRARVIRETRDRMAEEVRRLKGSRRTDPLAVLRRINDATSGKRRVHMIREAWPLVFRGLVRVEARVNVGGIGSVPETEWAVEVTDKGRRLLGRENEGSVNLPNNK